MPLGGYCDVCQAWVWVTPYGQCERGHPAASVRDVQQLRPSQPAAGGELVPAKLGDELAPDRPARFRFWWRHSLWVAWTFTAGFFNWVAFMYIGARARHITWALWGFFYMIPLALTIAALGTPLIKGAFILQMFFAAASVLHALYLRPYYRAIMFGDVPWPRALPAPPQPPPLFARQERAALPRGIDDEAADVLRAARSQVDAIAEIAGGLGKATVRTKVAALCRTADQILAELAQRPRKLGAARGFLNYYLDATERIVAGYAELGSRDSSSPEVQATLARAEEALDTVQAAFEQQLGNVLEDRVLDLEAEIELLEKTVRLDDLYTQTGGTA
jgi:hypothetical protein